MLVGAVAKVLDSLTCVLRSTEEEGVTAGGGLERELVKGHGLAASGLDAGAGGGGEAEGRDVDLGDLEEAVVVGNGPDNDHGALLIILDVVRDAREGDRGAVDAGHEQAAEDDPVEVGIGAAWAGRESSRVSMPQTKELETWRSPLTGQEAVKLHKELEVDIVALGRLAVRRALAALVKINS